VTAFAEDPTIADHSQLTEDRAAKAIQG